MPVAARRLESGTIWVDTAASGEAGRTVICARASSHDQRDDLDRHVARLTEWATSNGGVVGDVVTRSGPDWTGSGEIAENSVRPVCFGSRCGTS